MTGPATIDASQHGYDALMATLIGNPPANGGTWSSSHARQVAETFNARVIATVAAQQTDVKQTSKAGA